MSSALSSLMTSYGSLSESEEDEAPEGELSVCLSVIFLSSVSTVLILSSLCLSAIPILRVQDPVQEHQTPLSSQNAEADDTSQPASELNTPYSYRGRGRWGGRRGRGDRRHRRHPTLLEMVTSCEIMQAKFIRINYVCFFGINVFSALVCFCLLSPFSVVGPRHPTREEYPPAVCAPRRAEQLLWPGKQPSEAGGSQA